MLGAVVLIGGLFATAPPMPTIATAPIAGGMAIPTALPPTTPTPWPTPSPTLADLPIELIAEVPPALPTVSATLLPTATPTAGVWYAGGTLYTVTIAEWRIAEPRNRLATSADWVTAGLGLATLAEIEIYAPRILGCVDGTIDTYARGYTEAAPVVDVAALCILQLKDSLAPTVTPTVYAPAQGAMPVYAPEPGAICPCFNGDSRSCRDYATQEEAQACYDYCIAQGAGDVHGLDEAGTNGRACIWLPQKQVVPTVVIATPIPIWPTVEIVTPIPVATATNIPIPPFPTITSGGAICSCDGNIYNCGDLGSQEQACFNYCREQGFGDIHDLDRDHDLLACE